MDRRIDFILSVLGNPEGRTAPPRPDGPDWAGIVDLAVHHRVAPILYRKLEQGGGEPSVPGWAASRLRMHYHYGRLKSAVAIEQLSGIAQMLQGAGLDFIVLKGPHLAEMVYRDWALRPFADLDLLVRQADLPAVLSSLRNAGYHVDPEHRARRRQHHHLPLLRKEGSLPIEVHLGISSAEVVPHTADAGSLRERAEPMAVSGMKVLVLSKEDLLLNLALHVCQHRFRVPLLCLYDIAELMRACQRDIDWGELVSRARSWQAGKALFLVFELVRDLLGTAAPREARERLRPGDYRPRFLLEAESRIFCPRGIVSPSMEEMLLRKGVIGKSRLMRRSLFAREVLAGKYPVAERPYLAVFYFLCNLADLIVRHARILVRARQKEALDLQLALRKWLAAP